MNQTLFEALRDLQHELNAANLVEDLLPVAAHDRYRQIIGDDRKAYIKKALPKLAIINSILAVERGSDGSHEGQADSSEPAAGGVPSEPALEVPTDLLDCVVWCSDGGGLDFVETFSEFFHQANENFKILYRNLALFGDFVSQLSERFAEFAVFHDSSSQVSGTAMPDSSSVEEAGAADVTSSPSVANSEGDAK